MKIIENTPNRLLIRDNPYLTVFLGLLFGLIGLVITFFFARSVDVHCDKIEPGRVDCRLAEKLLGFQPIGGRMVKDVQKAEVAQSQDSEGNLSYRVIFLTATGRVPLTVFYSSDYTAKADLAQRINTFIQDASARSLDAALSMEWWIWIFFVVFGGLGGFMVLVSKRTTIEMVRSEGVVRIVKTGLFGSGQEEHPLQEIERVTLERSSTPRGTPTYRIALYTTDGGKRLLSRMYTSGRKGQQQAVQAMNTFLAPYRPPKE